MFQHPPTPVVIAIPAAFSVLYQYMQSRLQGFDAIIKESWNGKSAKGLLIGAEALPMEQAFTQLVQ